MKQTACWFIMAACTLLHGCSSRGHGDFLVHSVSSSAAARRAFELYDSNTDGQLSGEELKACAPLGDMLATYDADGDGSISRDELVARLDQLFVRGATLTTVSCSVVDGNRPVQGAKVDFQPAEFLDDVLESASGVTDSSGSAIIAMIGTGVPDELAGRPIMRIGLYRVTVEHGDRSAAFGHEVNNISRTGVNPTFDLQSARQ